jgi:hypothetical protein
MVNKDILNQYLDLREEVKEVRNSCPYSTVCTIFHLRL